MAKTEDHVAIYPAVPHSGLFTYKFAFCRSSNMQILLYYAPIACSLVPYVTLTEAGAEFETRAINLRKGQQRSPEYLQLNPKHKVPLLIVDGRKLTENVAINVWIARNFPQANLMPRDPWRELEAMSLLGW